VLPRIERAVRLAFALLAVLAAMSLVACGGDDEASTPLPVDQRFVTAEDAPGSKPDPDETRETTADFDEFIASLDHRAIDPDSEEIAEAFQEADFTASGTDTRFYGESHVPGSSTHIVSSFIELESADAAAKALDWLETDVRKPCPMSCATDRSSFDVDDVPEARGVRRIATAEDIENLGTSDEQPFESYWVGFTDGAIAYTIDLFGLPGSISEEQAEDIASAYHDRLTSG
jgi:hypothetical protein